VAPLIEYFPAFINDLRYGGLHFELVEGEDHRFDKAGHTSVTDPCFTGVDNVVMCTDTSTANAVQCSPNSGYLAISGAGSDTISYARVK
jgi:hypothetical protein